MARTLIRRHQHHHQRAERSGRHRDRRARRLTSTYDGWVQHGGKLGTSTSRPICASVRPTASTETIEADAQTRNDKLFGTHASLAPGQLNNQYKAIDANLDLVYGAWRALRLQAPLRHGQRRGHFIGARSGRPPAKRTRHGQPELGRAKSRATSGWAPA
jgi:iron complex outermembrane receptor protein